MESEWLHLSPLLNKAPHANTPWEEAGESKRRASAVCMLFAFLPDQTTKIVFIKRTTTMSQHRGQIGFPGGHREAQDTSPKDTALREMEEEIGIPREQVMVVGRLDEVASLNGTPVIPIVACAYLTESNFSPNPAEVADIMLVPWHQLTRSGAEFFRFMLFGIKRKSVLYRTEPYNIWGLTAKIVYSADIESCIKHMQPS